jgi:hypothetical protein
VEMRLGVERKRKRENSFMLASSISPGEKLF